MNIIYNRKNLYIILSVMVVMLVSWIIFIIYLLICYDLRFVLYVNNVVKRVLMKIYLRVLIKYMLIICKLI